MSQHALHHLDVGASAYRQARRGVAQVVRCEGRQTKRPHRWIEDVAPEAAVIEQAAARVDEHQIAWAASGEHRYEFLRHQRRQRHRTASVRLRSDSVGLAVAIRDVVLHLHPATHQVDVFDAQRSCFTPAQSCVAQEQHQRSILGARSTALISEPRQLLVAQEPLDAFRWSRRFHSLGNVATEPSIEDGEVEHIYTCTRTTLKRVNLS